MKSTKALYPNPTNDLVTLEMNLSKEVTCHVYSLLGERLLSKPIKSSNQTLDLSELPANIYFLQIGDETIKVIKTQ